MKKNCMTCVLAALLLAAPAQAGVIFTENWDGAPLGAITIPGPPAVASSAHTWTVTRNGSGTPAAIEIADFSGDRKFSNTAAGTGTGDYGILTSETISGFVTGKAITVEFDVRDYTPATTSNQRVYVLVENSNSLDSYRIRFSSQTTSEEVLNATITDDGVEVGDKKFDDSNNGSGGFGVPNANGEWHVKMSFFAIGADTKVTYEVTGLNGTPNLLAPNSWTFTSAGVQDAFDRVSVWMRRPLAEVDNLIVSQDTTAPVINLIGNANLTVQCGAYSDPGVTALDDVEGDLTANVQAVSTVQATTLGNYTVTYTVSDSSGNAAATVVRNVQVVDTTDPVVTLNGSSNLSISCGAGFSDPGASALDACDGPLIPVVTGTVNTVVPDTYTITYTATDGEGNVGTATRTVTVLNDCPPILITATTAVAQIVEEGDEATFGISALGNGTLSYQWYFDDGSKVASLISGANSALLTIDPVTVLDEGTYYCLVSDDLSTDIQSPLFTLELAPQLPVAGLPGLLAVALATTIGGMAALRRRK